MPNELVSRFFGGPPLAVLGRLILLSILVFFLFGGRKLLGHRVEPGDVRQPAGQLALLERRRAQVEAALRHDLGLVIHQEDALGAVAEAGESCTGQRVRIPLTGQPGDHQDYDVGYHPARDAAGTIVGVTVLVSEVVERQAGTPRP